MVKTWYRKISHFLVEDISKKYNMISHQQLNSVNKILIFYTPININKHWLTVIVDLSKSKNLMSLYLTNKESLLIWMDKNTQNVMIID